MVAGLLATLASQGGSGDVAWVANGNSSAAGGDGGAGELIASPEEAK